ncbi:MAG: primosomal protein N' [Candidatus Hydrogenedentes bacterium]|jgi:primosomal protein N' (replication factor Y)|nr:primosomal protein N' [Candidatus Hydrogenedentota bacterium]
MPDAPRRFVDVALPIPIENPFTYEAPPSLQDRIAVGMRVVVPLGRRVETGFAVGFPSTADENGLKKIIDLPDAAPIISDEMMGVCRWIAEYYCCSLGEALNCTVPAGIRIRSKKRYTLVTERLGEGRYTKRQQQVIAALHRRGPLMEAQLAKEAGARALSNTLQALVGRGLILEEVLADKGSVSMKTETWAVLVEAKVPDGDALAAMQRRASKQASVYLDLLNGEAERPAASLYEKHGVNAATLHALEKKGFIRREEREAYRAPDLETSAGPPEKHELNGEQAAAYNAITDALESKEFATLLLQGITGSGKTEVYLRTIEHVLSLGKDAIILVPEISLTPQTVGRFVERFDVQIAVLHSGLGAGERYDEWRRAQRGEVRIVVGARSAVFAPLPNLGIIVVDEEHDHSYKQGDVPRYHARDVAIVRAKLSGGVCVLGSATPSIESFHNTERDKSVCLVLSRRATRSELPSVEIVDMRTEIREEAGENFLSKRLDKALKARIAKGEQAMLLLNRRGHSPFVLCPKCSWVADCENCQVSLTYHAKGGFLSCHYCNAQREIPQVCNECHFNPLIYLGVGTQKIEDFLRRAFPKTNIERMDADTTAGKGGHAKILGRFAAGEIDVLVGTQMLAKGHDYPGVTLVGVVNADTGLSIPDFRAAEQSFQLLTQVAGRAGRGDTPGEVIIQTYRPKHFAVQAAAKHDFHGFYTQEIEFRRQAGYPPFRRLVHYTLESEDLLDAERYAGILKRVIVQQIQTLGFRGVEVVGPAPATIRRVKKKYRWNLGAFSKSAKRLNTLTRAVRKDFSQRAPKSVALKVDLDPYGMF